MKLFHKARNKLKELLNFIQAERSKKAKAIAFVDFEHWFYSYKNLFHMRPDIVQWGYDIKQKYSVKDIMVFANFSNKEMRKELVNIRTITNSIIETEQITTFSKDMTDFIMLDYIYQYINEHPDTEVFILFTGDAHFQSVVKYLIQKCNKKVIVYGVKNAFSVQLKQVASEAIELPVSEEIIQNIYPLIVNNMAYVSSKFDIIPTFTATARTISSQNDIPEEYVKIALNEMKKKGLLYTHDQRVEFNRFVPVLAANWEALEKAGLWSFD